MTLSIDLPDHAAQVLREAYGENLNRAALESIAVEGYRSGTLSRFQVQKILGFDNYWATENWLAEHGLNLNYSVADLEADRKTLETLLGSKP